MTAFATEATTQVVEKAHEMEGVKNPFIILARTLRKFGKSNEWFSKLVEGKRAAYGKFAILLAFEIVLRK